MVSILFEYLIKLLYLMKGNVKIMDWRNIKIEGIANIERGV